MPKGRPKRRRGKTEKKRAVDAINRLPAEILQDIFYLCTFQDVDVDTPLKPDRRAAPWILTQVCRSWRSLSISHSALWSSISLKICHPCRQWKSGGHKLSDPPLNVVKCWLDRSSPSPLLIDLDIGIPNPTLKGKFSKVPGQVIKHIHSHIHHVKTLSIQGSPSERKEDAYSCPWLLQGADILETLDISYFPECIGPSSPSYLPRLRNLTLTDPECARLALPWSQLRQLCLAGAEHFVDIIPVLKETPMLESFETSDLFSCQAPHCEYAGSKVPLLHLTRLQLEGSPEGTIPFLGLLHVPALRDLEVQVLDTYTTRDAATPLTTLCENAPHLKSLSIHFLPISRESFTRLLRKVPSLTRLEIKETPEVDDVVLKLFYKGQICCPSLESLTLDDCLTASPGTLSLMVESRINQSGSRNPLFELCVYEGPSGKGGVQYAVDKERLEELKSQRRLLFVDWEEWEELSSEEESDEYRYGEYDDVFDDPDDDSFHAYFDPIYGFRESDYDRSD